MSFNGDLYPTAGADVVMTTKGDVVRFDSQRERYGIGSTNQVLSVTAGLPAWKTLTTADSVLTTQGDVLIEGASGLERLGFGTSGYFLTTNGTGANPTWTAGGVGDMLLGTVQNITAAKTFNDSVKCYFGTDDDANIYHSGSNMYIACGTGNIFVDDNFAMDAGTCLALNRAQATVSSGGITGTSNTMLISAEGGASTDDLDYGNFTAAGVTGCMFTLIAYQDAQTIVVKDQTTGSGQFLGAGDFSLDSYMDTIYFVADAGQTHNQEISRSDNGS